MVLLYVSASLCSGVIRMLPINFVVSCETVFAAAGLDGAEIIMSVSAKYLLNQHTRGLG